MNNQKSRSLIFLFLIFTCASLVRVIFDTSLYILNIIAFINVVSFIYVFYIIIDSGETLLKNKLHSETFTTERNQSMRLQNFKKKMTFLSFSLAILGLFYIIFIAHPIINDIISLFALFTSIETDYLTSVLAKHFLRVK